jgi:hypothetical protein
LSDNWLRHVQDVREKHERRLPANFAMLATVYAALPVYAPN